MLDTTLPTTFPSAHCRAKWVSFLLIVNVLISAVGCSTVTETARLTSDQSTSSPRSADELLVVDCLLPGQIRKLGRSLVYLTPGRPVKTSAQDCEIRGGEYVSYDRSDYATALKIWLPLAKEGDKVAQTYVGEIYEKGLGVQPDYALAVEWYRKAAEQGYERAQINLGYLYEKGLGVQRDPTTALDWYRKAAGLSYAIAIDPTSINTKANEELKELRREVERRTRESESLRQQLERSRQQLEQTQRELEQRAGEAEAAQQQLEKARQELEMRKEKAEAARDYAEVGRLEEQLKRREADVEHQNHEMTRLRQKVAQLEAEAEQRRKQLVQANEQQVALAGPTIELIDPPLLTRDGAPRVKTHSGIERMIVGKVTAPAGLLAFTVNDRQKNLEENGLFRMQIPVQRSNIPVTIVAIDKQGKRASVEFLLTADEPVSEAKAGPVSAAVVQKKPVLATAEFGTYHALIIGNKQYTYWPKLATPEEDAKETAKVLREKYGFKTTVLLNATRYDILRALNEARKELTEKDNLLIYYAGHGQLDDKIGRGYWVPVDGEIDSNANWISTFAITDMINALSAKHVLVVADTCYAGALTRSALARLEAGMSDEARYHWLKVMAEKRSRTVLTSGDLKPVLDSGGGKHSVFAKAFLDVLRENGGILEGQRLHQGVSARVSYAAAAVMTDEGPVDQVPQYAPIKYAGHESGDFLFVPTVP
jgi:multidrug efflux pump subunit AcrA (membrane-fusion protein)